MPELVRHGIDKGRRGGAVRYLVLVVCAGDNGAGIEDLCFVDEGLALAVATSDRSLPFVAGLSAGGCGS